MLMNRKVLMVMVLGLSVIGTVSSRPAAACLDSCMGEEKPQMQLKRQREREAREAAAAAAEAAQIAAAAQDADSFRAQVDAFEKLARILDDVKLERGIDYKNFRNAIGREQTRYGFGDDGHEMEYHDFVAYDLQVLDPIVDEGLALNDAMLKAITDGSIIVEKARALEEQGFKNGDYAPFRKYVDTNAITAVSTSILRVSSRLYRFNYITVGLGLIQQKSFADACAYFGIK